jgi:hypothetical protein
LAAGFHGKSKAVAEYAALAVVGLNALPAWRRPDFIALLRETIAEEIMDEVLEKLAREAEEEAEQAVIGTWAYNRGRRRGQEEGRLIRLKTVEHFADALGD